MCSVFEGFALLCWVLGAQPAGFVISQGYTSIYGQEEGEGRKGRSWCDGVQGPGAGFSAHGRETTATTTPEPGWIGKNCVGPPRAQRYPRRNNLSIREAFHDCRRGLLPSVGCQRRACHSDMACVMGGPCHYKPCHYLNANTMLQLQGGGKSPLTGHLITCSIPQDPPNRNW